MKEEERQGGKKNKEQGRGFSMPKSKQC